MENPTNCPLPPRRFRSKFAELLFSLSDSATIIAVAFIVIALSYTVFFTIQYADQENFNSKSQNIKATILNFEVAEVGTRENSSTTYRYTLFYAYNNITYKKILDISSKEKLSDASTTVGGVLKVALNEENPTEIRYVTHLNQYRLPPNVIFILIFTIAPALVIRYWLPNRLKILPLFKMGLPAFGTVTKTNKSGLSTQHEKFIQYHFSFEAFDGKSYHATSTAGADAFGDKPVLVLYNLSNPEENIVVDGYDSAPQINADGSLSLRLTGSTQVALIFSVGIISGIIALLIYISIS
jgi:hypothetical protein